jgi:hypothetical protein
MELRSENAKEGDLRQDLGVDGKVIYFFIS